MAVAGAVTESPASIELDPNFNAELGWHSGEAFFTIPVAFHEELQGREQILLEVLYQVCDDRSCLPPKTKEIVPDDINICDDLFCFGGQTRSVITHLIKNFRFCLKFLISCVMTDRVFHQQPKRA